MSKEKTLTQTEIQAASLAEAKRIYHEKLDTLFHTQGKIFSKSLGVILFKKALLETAKEISTHSNDPCSVCAYGSNGFDICNLVSAGVFDDLDLDPCFDGVLKYLTEQTDIAPVNAVECDIAFDEKQVELIKEIRKFIQANLDTIHAFADLSVKATKRSYGILPEQTKYIISLLGTIRDITELLQPNDFVEKQEKAV